MERDGLTASEAEELIEEARGTLQEYIEEGDLTSAHDICQEFFGLEPDYIMELM